MVSFCLSSMHSEVTVVLRRLSVPERIEQVTCNTFRKHNTRIFAGHSTHSYRFGCWSLRRFQHVQKRKLLGFSSFSVAFLINHKGASGSQSHPSTSTLPRPGRYLETHGYLSSVLQQYLSTITALEMDESRLCCQNRPDLFIPYIFCMLIICILYYDMSAQRASRDLRQARQKLARTGSEADQWAPDYNPDNDLLFKVD
ncbi:hypothetical protein EDB82DRAFT_181718 [Fusarium venenatum]|uniref:uncharacterized protein n=1 Tax=Fusarium venenatum TaxID=56646 RepID=UPI001E103278|nr:hypothetical protein EDB82DRAFT_181718 [Fusarium venenatum]